MKAFYCAGTHWDREWYEPFQEFRRWLVELVDELIDLMEKDSDYKSFHLDGQTVTLEDYLEIRPERREQLLKLIRERRLLVGPWYNLPDEWLISGESFVRNLMRGLRICQQLDIPHLDFAYTPDQFGHIAALPMIMRGFGLSAGICWRGTQDENYPAQFAWVGPDGKKLAYHKLMDKGSYAPFQFFFRDKLREAGYTDEAYSSLWKSYFTDEKNRCTVPLLLMLDAIDHIRPDHKMPEILGELKKRNPDIDFQWTSLEEYGRELAKHLDALPERHGELREPVRDHTRLGQYLIVHTISSRYDLKKRNDQCQALMEKWVEPMLLMEMMDGGTPVSGFADTAWKYLLRNHPHDSICGCSIDQVHRDMHYRFDQCEQIADGCVRGSMARIAKASAGPDDWTRVAVHNPLPRSRKGVFDLTLFFPADHPEKSGKSYIDGLAWSERYNKFHLVLPDGSRVPYQHVRVERRQETRQRLDGTGRQNFACGDLYHLAVELDLPAMGYTTLKIEPCDEATRTFGSLMTGPLSSSNGMIEFTVNADGSGTLMNLEDGRIFTGLFQYEDSGEVGDGWTHGQPLNDIVYRGAGTAVMTAVEEDGPLRTVFRIERKMAIPREIDPKTGYRSDDRVMIEIADFVTVAKHSPILHVRTLVNNTATDHRLRVLFPTGANNAQKSFADTPFAMVEREIAIPRETAEWQERINPEKAFSSICGIKDANGGLAALCPFGLHEYAVLDLPERPLAITLFRSFRKTVGRSEQTDGQLQGKLEFEYALLPVGHEFHASSALNLVAELQTGLRSHDVDQNAAEIRSFMTVTDRGTVVTALKSPEQCNGAVIRLWNPNPAVSAFAEISLDRPITGAFLCNLNEDTEEPLTFQNTFLSVKVPPGGLTTVRLVF